MNVSRGELITLPPFSIWAVRVCPACGRHYAVLPSDKRAVECCGREAPLAPSTAVAPGTPIYLPRPEQFADPPVIVEARE